MESYQVALLAVFAVSSLHAAYKAINQAREDRRLRERELRWRQSEQARLVLNELEDDEDAQIAMLCLDWDGRTVTLLNKTKPLMKREIDVAMRVVNTNTFTDREVAIRDCYDHLFYQFERIAQWIEVDLISIYDVLFPISYLAECMAERRVVFETFLCQYRYFGSLNLVRRFKAWGGDLDAQSVPPPPPKRTQLQAISQFITDIDPLKPPGIDKIYGAKAPPAAV